MGHKKYLILVCLLLLFGVFIYLGNYQSTMVPSVLASEISMEPTIHDSVGVDLNTEFIFQAERELDPKFIIENIVIEPSLAFTVNKSAKDSKEAVLVPLESLQPHKIYKFTLAREGQSPLKWAFQTKGDFKVVSTLPRDKTTGVPLDTGIEINLSHLNFDNFTKYFSITPEVPGSFEVHKKTVVFVPEKLKPATVYTITINKELPLVGSSQKLAEDYVFQFETREEREQNRNLNYMHIYKNNHEFTTREKPFFQLGYFNYQKKEQPEGKVAVYSYQDSREYIKALEEREKVPYWSYLGRLGYREDTRGLTQVANFTLPLQGQENLSFLEFPDPLPAGFYVAEISLENSLKQVWFQVTDLGFYAAVANNKTLIWVNDLVRGLPVRGAEVKLLSGATAKTNEKGLVELLTPKDILKGLYFVITKDQQEGVAAIFPESYGDLEWEKQYSFQNSYWRYLYLDRSLYKPNDIVHFWGVLKPRDAKGELDKKITVDLTKWSGGDYVPIQSKEIVVQDFNFTGSIKLPNLLPGYYYLVVKLEDNVLITQSFDVENYSKPVYQIEANPERKAIFAGEKIDFRVNATFFEGTPASKISLNYHIHDKSGKMTTNAQGEGSISYLTSYQEKSYSSIDPRYLYLTANLPESGEIRGESRVLVLNNDLAINTKEKVRENTAQIELELNKLTLEKVNSGQVDTWEKDAFIEKSASNHMVKVKIYEEVWEKREVGQYYDFLNKKVMPRFDYHYKKVPYLEGEVITDIEGKAKYDFPVREKAAYLVEFSAQDFRGNLAFQEQRVYGRSFYLEYDYPWYHLEKEKSSGKYSIGEEVKILFKKNQGLIPEREDGFLFFTCRDGILKGEIQDTGIFNTVFLEELAPNFWVKGVCFDGRFYYETPQDCVHFNEEEKALEIKAMLDKEKYRPKETVKVNLEVKNKKNTPVEAIVNLNLVDEALYALRDQYTNVLYALYGTNLPSGIKSTLITHQPPDPGLGGAEKGGEGGSERKDFKDTVFFKTVTTDREGKAMVEFQVPDNLTSWRLTCQAITEDLEAGTVTSQVKVKLPFFVDMILADTYLTGDEIIVPIRSFGSQLKENTEVQYELTLRSEEKVIKSENLSGQAFTITGVALPPLIKGEYDLTVSGKSVDGLRDTLTLSFQVVDSLATIEQTEFFPLEKNLKISENVDSPVTLIFANYQRSHYLDLLWRLNMASGARIEHRMASVLGENLIREYFPGLIQNEVEKNTNFLSYQLPEGGVSILPYADADLELSVKLATLNSEAFDSTMLAYYFTGIVNDPKESRERAIIALAGLAALNEPVLQEIDIILKYQDLTVKERLYLSLALMELGDEKRAKETLQSLFEVNTEKLGPFLRINTGQDQDDVLEATALAAILAVGLNFDDEAGKLEAYVLDNSSKDILLYLEQLMFLERALPKLSPKPVSFSYKLDEKTENIILKPEKSFSLILTPDKVQEIEFSKIEGEIGVTAFYQLPFQAPKNLSKDEVKITRQYEVAGKPTQEFNLNDLVRVKISYQFGPKAPDGPYELINFLPAGLKIVERPYYRGIDDRFLGYPVEIDGPKAVFLIYDKKDGYFNYYARVINPGRFRAEQAILKHGKSGIIYSVSTQDGVSIK